MYEVRLIGSNGEQVGVVKTKEALSMAKDEGLDLIMISASANPPVCKIINFGQFRYNEQKKEKNAKKNSKVQVIKELKFSPKISEHDYQVRLKSGIKFLKKGNLVKASIFFKGRERSHPEIGKDLLNRYINDIKEYGDVSTGLTYSHRSLYLIINPK